MIYGMYLSASGVLTAMSRQDVYSNNLANLSTAGFKPEVAGVRQREVVRKEDGVPFLESNALLERLGGGVLLQETWSTLAPAPLEETGSSLDVAVEGRGFLVVDTGRGVGEERFRLTRDGRMALDSEGRLVRSTDGLPLVDEDGEVIYLNRASPISITSDGGIRQRDEVVARLRLTDVRDAGSLLHEGAGMFRAAPGSQIAAIGTLRQGHIERSGVDPVTALMDITKAGSAVEQNARMIQLHYETVGRLITTLGRVA